jgi:hypothetical protein
VARAIITMLLVLAGCSKEDAFHVEHFAQQDGHEVCLNEPLIFRFSHQIDRSTITVETARISSDQGEVARGRWVVKGRELRFLPRLPLEPDCSDSGLSPGRTYTVHLTGHPAYCAVTSIEGFHLEASRRYTFGTIPYQDEKLAMFVDPEPETSLKIIEVGGGLFPDLDLDGIVLEAGSALELVFSKPLFPEKVYDSEAMIDMVFQKGALIPERVPLKLMTRILNKKPRGAVIAIEPEMGFQKDARYNLWLETLDFKDFGGRSLETPGHISIDCTGGSPP